MAPLKLLADENIELRVVQFLRSLSIDVMSVSEEDPGVDDDVVIRLAASTDRILLTGDKDFGYLVYFMGQQHKGVILLRFTTQLVSTKITVLKNFFQNFDLTKISGKFVVVSEKGVKIAD